MSAFPSLTFAGLPLLVSPLVPPSEIWLIVEGKRETIYCHEGPRAGESVETWLRRAEIHRIINLGEPRPGGREHALFDLNGRVL